MTESSGGSGRRWAASEIGRRSATLASFVLIARGLSTEDFAKFALITAGFSIMLTVVQSAVDRLLVRTWIERPDEARHLARLSTCAVTLLTLVASGICLGIERQIAVNIALYGVSVIAQVAIWGEETRRRARGDLTASNRLKSIGEITPSAARAFGAIAGGTLGWVMLGSATSGVAIAWLGRANLMIPQREGLERAGVRSALVAAGVGLGSAAYFRLDLFMLSALASDSDVAGYAIAIKLLEVVLVIPSVYGQLSIAEFVRSSEAARRAWAQGLRLTRWGLVIAVLLAALALPIHVAADAVLRKPVSTAVVALLALTVPAAYYGAVLGNVCFARHREGTLLRMLGVMLVLNAALNIIIIPELGAPGAAMTTAATELVGVGLLAARLRTTTRGMRQQPAG